MPIHNEDIAAVFDDIADLLEIEAANPFRVRAYRNAAMTLRELGEDVRRRIDRGDDLTALPGIGKALAAKILEIVSTGKCTALEKLRRRFPADLTELLRLPGLGPKRVHALYHDLDIHSPVQLERAARDGTLRELPGFGAKTEARLLEALEAHADTAQRFKLATAARYAQSLVEYLQSLADVDRVVVAGSYRRSKETVGDLDILVTVAAAPRGTNRRSGKAARSVIDAFTRYDEVSEVLAGGSTRATVILRSTLQVDLRVVEQPSFGAALHYFTGSRAHNIAVRRLAQKHGLKINEYGVFRGEERIAGDTEASVFAAVGLPYIEPELREDRGEIEAARAGLLPKLVRREDLRGDLHAHTSATDGHETIRVMAQAALARGLTYLAVTDHSKRLTVAHGLDPRRLLSQLDEIDELNETLTGITLLKGIEVDILEDGSLDMPDKVLSKLDLVIGAVHSKFDLSRARQTRRILRAMDNRWFTLLAHPTGRLLDRRAPYAVDMPRIIRHARERGCWLELNAHPERLDLLDVHCRMAKDEGVMVGINSDAHAIADFDNLVYGVGQARRGWLEKTDVVNTRPLGALRKLLAKTR
jgi:DNA polymerase (family 10)